MSGAPADRGVIVATRDLFFRAKLEAVIRTAGHEPRRDGPARLAVVELGDARGVERLRALVASGIPVLAFASHVRVDLLQAARDAGAVAVPNSAIEEALRRRLAPA